MAQENQNLPVSADMQAIGLCVTELIRPVMETIGKLLEHNTEALEQLRP